MLAELRLGLGVHISRKRVARLMRLDRLVGVSHRRKRRGWKPDTATHEDLVKRQFRADAPNRLWLWDITQHRARNGWVYCAAVIDAFSRRIVGWSISVRITAEIVVDALEMARWRRRPEPGTVVHADRGAQYASWLFEHRLRQAGLLGSMGRVASSVDNALIESFWSTMQRELLDRTAWISRREIETTLSPSARAVLITSTWLSVSGVLARLLGFATTSGSSSTAPWGSSPRSSFACSQAAPSRSNLCQVFGLSPPASTNNPGSHPGVSLCVRLIWPE
ncbi:IS3 family transposase [Microbacterium sp.]|uniref:IS3 family transposase n=1 Tax=Microbacterium sp. TaxID=51671 RepID=UPI00324203BA